MRTAATSVVTSIQPLGPFIARLLRRLGDMAVAGVLLLLLSPLVLIAAIAVRMQTGESALYRHSSLDAYGRPFPLYRLRTMTEERDYQGKLLPDYKRVTPLGRWLYATRLYKVPSLWNVVRGDIDSI